VTARDRAMQPFTGDFQERLDRLRAEMSNDRLCSCGAVITLISGRWIESDGTAMHAGSGHWAAHRPLNDAQREA
jgi:hypothetical protein